MSGPVLFTLTLLLLVGIVAMAWRFSARRQQALAQATPTSTSDGLQIPVNGIETLGGGVLGASQRNSLNPQFVIGRDAVHFKLVSRQQWDYADIAQVDVRSRRNGWVLHFVGRGSRGVVLVDVIGESNALAALRALPDFLDFTELAERLRDGTVTGASGQ